MKRRPHKADLILAQPAVAAALAAIKASARRQDIALLTRLAKRLTGRVSHPVRRQRFASIVRRDPVLVAFRYLKRHAEGPWHRGGHHVARLFAGPGIAFPHWRNDRAVKITPRLINV